VTAPTTTKLNAGDDLYGAAAERSTQMKWTNDTNFEPCQMLSMLSCYGCFSSNLIILYSISCCLAVVSASTKRALSKLNIVKNWLRSSLCNEMLHALLVLACDKDLLVEMSNFSTISIISRFAVASRQFAQSALAVYVDSRL
jgi:hypothetical protein